MSHNYTRWTGYGRTLQADGVPIAFLNIYIGPVEYEGGPATRTLPPVAADELSVKIARLLEEDARRTSLEALNTSGGAAWCVENPPDVPQGQPQPPIRMDLVGALDCACTITIGPRIPDGLFLKMLRSLYKAFAMMEKAPEPPDDTHRGQRVSRPIRRRRIH